MKTKAILKFLYFPKKDLSFIKAKGKDLRISGHKTDSIIIYCLNAFPDAL
jgi:hypothetical protein